MSDPAEWALQSEDAVDKASSAGTGRGLGNGPGPGVLAVLSAITAIASVVSAHYNYRQAAEILAAFGLVSGAAALFDILKGYGFGGQQPDPDDRRRRRVAEVSAKLKQSAESFKEASVLLVEMQQEITSRSKILVDLREKVTDYQQLANNPPEAARALEDMLKAVHEGQDERTKKLTWLQGSVFAAFGAAVAVCVVIFSHYLPTPGA